MHACMRMLANCPACTTLCWCHRLAILSAPFMVRGARTFDNVDARARRASAWRECFQCRRLLATRHARSLARFAHARAAVPTPPPGSRQATVLAPGGKAPRAEQLAGIGVRSACRPVLYVNLARQNQP